MSITLINQKIGIICSTILFNNMTDIFVRHVLSSITLNGKVFYTKFEKVLNIESQMEYG